MASRQGEASLKGEGSSRGGSSRGGSSQSARSSQAEVRRRMRELAAGQHGVVTSDQIMAAGATADTIRSWRRSGRLAMVHRGVYLPGSLVGPLAPARYREMAAVLACGRGAAVSHGNALWLRDLLPARPTGAVHLVVPLARCRRPGIRAHRVSALPPEDVSLVEGIPTTTVIRSVLDLASVARARFVEQVIARAERLGQLDSEELLRRLDRAPVRGAPLLRSLLTNEGGPAFTRSEAEDRFLEIVRLAELPAPQANVRLRDIEVDFYFPAHRVAVEVDGFAHHSTRRSFERDRDRDFGFGADGVQVVRVTWRQLQRKPHIIVRRLTAILTRAEVLAGIGRPGQG